MLNDSGHRQKYKIYEIVSESLKISKSNFMLKVMQFRTPEFQKSSADSKLIPLI